MSRSWHGVCVWIVGKFVWLGRFAEVLSGCLWATVVFCFTQSHLRSNGSTCVSSLSPVSHKDILRGQDRWDGWKFHYPTHLQCFVPRTWEFAHHKGTSADYTSAFPLAPGEVYTMWEGERRHLDNCLSSCTGSSFYRLIKFSFIDINLFIIAQVSIDKTFSFTLHTSLCSHVQTSGRVTKQIHVGKTQICPVQFKDICLMLVHWRLSWRPCVRNCTKMTFSQTTKTTVIS